MGVRRVCRSTRLQHRKRGNVRYRLIRLVAAFGLLATVACGARLSNQQYVEARGAGAGGGGGATTNGTKAATASGTPTAGGSSAAGGATSGATGGDQTAAGGAPAQGAGCTPQHSDAPGVTDTE